MYDEIWSEKHYKFGAVRQLENTSWEQYKQQKPFAWSMLLNAVLVALFIAWCYFIFN